MMRRIPLGPVFPGWGMLAVLGGAYVAWEHQQGRHREFSAVCGLCWLNRLSASAPSAQSETGETSETSETSEAGEAGEAGSTSEQTA